MCPAALRAFGATRIPQARDRGRRPDGVDDPRPCCRESAARCMRGATVRVFALQGAAWRPTPRDPESTVSPPRDRRQRRRAAGTRSSPLPPPQVCLQRSSGVSIGRLPGTSEAQKQRNGPMSVSVRACGASDCPSAQWTDVGQRSGMRSVRLPISTRAARAPSRSSAADLPRALRCRSAPARACAATTPCAPQPRRCREATG
jgi:hypothetical protein